MSQGHKPAPARCGKCGLDLDGKLCPRCREETSPQPHMKVTYHDFKLSEMLEIRQEPAAKEAAVAPERTPDGAPRSNGAPTHRGIGLRAVLFLLLGAVLLGGSLLLIRMFLR